MKLTLVGLLGLAVLLPPAVAEACGGGDVDAAHASGMPPEGPYEEFAAGKLGVLWRSLSPRFMAYAWRSMMRIPTTAEEQRQVVADWQSREASPWDEASTLASDQWLAIRREVARSPVDLEPRTFGESHYSVFARINPDAFFKAGATARALAAEWEERPELVEEWALNQDNVFGACEPLRATLPELAFTPTPREQARRVFERDYQAAAAHFYCDRFDDAKRAFQAIAASANSPYRSLAAYLVVRTHVRKLLRELPSEDSGERKLEGAVREGFVQADQALQKVLDDPKLREVHGPTLRLQSLVRSRLSQGAWRCELYSRVLQKGTGTGLGAQLMDLVPPGEELPKDCPGLPPDAAELAEWLQLMRHESVDLETSSKDFTTAVARWKRTKHQPWLVLALMSARGDSPGLPALLTAAEKVPVDAPAGLTLAWLSVKLSREQGAAEKARARLDAIPQALLLARPGAAALLRDERLHLARSWDEALRHTLEFDVRDPKESPQPDETPDTSRREPQGFSSYRLAYLEHQLTTRRMRELTSSPRLPPGLRRQWSWTTFARAAVVEDDETLVAMAKQLAETEPKAREELLAITSRPTEEERHFEARLLLMGLPAVSAYIQPRGLGWPELSPPLDLTQNLSARSNGWCALPKEYAQKPVESPFAFVSPEERAAAGAEYTELAEAGHSVVFFSRVALDQAKAHPADPRSPIALFRAVHASKRGCMGQGTAEARQAFSWLHKHYGKTEWAKRAPYVY